MGDEAAPSVVLDATMLSVSETVSTVVDSGPDPLVGTRLKHFEVVELLGRGGMGAVYLANDTSLERQVAIKVLNPEIASDSQVVSRFVREARTQARLRHPNVAQIYFIGEERGIHFFVMEYVNGLGVDRLLASRQTVPWPQAIEHIISASRGLRAAAELGFIHRDVKPSNLMIDRDAGIKILDFGLVKTLHDDAQLTRAGMILGSPMYMSPEQGHGESVDCRSDIYSLGCSLYHMLTGGPPFTASSPMGVITKHVTESATPVRALVPEVPEPVERLVARMMEKDPARRFQNYDQLLETAERARPGQRELSGFRRRTIALAIDLAPLVAAAYFLGPWIAPIATAYFILCHRLAGQTLGKWLLGIEVTNEQHERISWKAAALRFLVFAWAPIAWSALGLIVYFVHRADRVSFKLAELTAEELAFPLLYASIAALIFVGYLAGFLVAAFHPKRLALHDILCGTQARNRVNRRVARITNAVRNTLMLRRPPSPA